MTGLAILLLLVVVILAGAWFFFHHLGRLHNITTWEAARDYLRKDLDAGPLTMGRINFTYRGLMRATGPKGPKGEVMPVHAIIVEMPEEDYLFVHPFGLGAFVAQLEDYRHTYALKQGWLEPGDDPVPVSVRRSTVRKRLRPQPLYEVVHDGKTHRFTGEALRTRTAATEHLGETARLSCEGKEWTLVPADAPYRFGRDADNEIHVPHPEVSSYHATISFSGSTWFLEPLRTTNPTKIGGRVVRGATVLAPGATITIGSFGPLVFDAGREGSSR